VWIEPHNGKFRIRDRRANRVVTVKSGIGTKTAAKQILTKLSADKLMGEFIDPRAGKVTATVDLTGLLPAADRAEADVLNGIAAIPETDEFLVTGKLWPTMFRVKFVTEGD
jgi:hypothetical protein